MVNFAESILFIWLNEAMSRISHVGCLRNCPSGLGMVVM